MFNFQTNLQPPQDSTSLYPKKQVSLHCVPFEHLPLVTSFLRFSFGLHVHGFHCLLNPACGPVNFVSYFISVFMLLPWASNLPFLCKVGFTKPLISV